ncbi:vitamin B12-binding protein [Ligilactobacillus ruminis]|nr:vitamin B12-binding protein [Ligilactobacillus ruminis]MDB7642051.1 vitamin B12-binding protein [Ligilactobacillus ruminis]MDB7648972.1 vitamin B12-binding protein [Ligilactobacillus ruminis]
MSKIAHLPVTEGRLLRADFKNRPFARNRGLTFTGRFQKSTLDP